MDIHTRLLNHEDKIQSTINGIVETAAQIVSLGKLIHHLPYRPGPLVMPHLTQPTVPAAIEIKGDYEVIFRCGNCDGLNVNDLELTDGPPYEQRVCPDCHAINLFPKYTYCECEDCQSTMHAAEHEHPCVKS
jgi:hypothetical protein